MGGLDTSCHASQVILSNSFRLTSHSSYWTKSFQGYNLNPQLPSFSLHQPMSLEVTNSCCVGKHFVSGPAELTGEKEAHLSSLSATPFETGLVWKGLRIFFLAVTSKLRWMLELELQGLHFYYYYNIRASLPCVYKCPMTANSLAWGCSMRLCLHRSMGWGITLPQGSKPKWGWLNLMEENASWAHDGQQHALISGGRAFV